VTMDLAGDGHGDLLQPRDRAVRHANLFDLAHGVVLLSPEEAAQLDVVGVRPHDRQNSRLWFADEAKADLAVLTGSELLQQAVHAVILLPFWQEQG
jgi:hypothetical protein